MLNSTLSANRALLAILLLAVMLLASTAPQTTYAQPADAPADTQATQSADDEAAASDDSSADQGDEAPAADEQAEATADADTEGEAESSEAAPEEGDAEEVAAPGEAAATGTAAGDAAQPGAFDWGAALIALAVLILPIVIGNWLARQLKMPDYSWKISLMLVTIAVSAYCVATRPFKGGVDLNGGVTLIYEVEDKSLIEQTADGEQAPAAENETRRSVKISEIIGALKRRVDPAGTKEVSIRQLGNDIEVIIPKASGADLDYIKKRLTDPGELEFRITASEAWPVDRPLIEAARSRSPSQKSVEMGGRIRGRWVEFSEAEFGDGAGLVTRQAGDRREALVKIDSLDVTGKYLVNPRSGWDDRTSRPAVEFNFDTVGSRLFGKLTGDNLPNATTGAVRRLGILLNKELISAPNLNEKITGSGQISGGSMNQADVDNLVAVLHAGSLPAALNRTPISESETSATLGKVTIDMATKAIVVSLAAVLVFILFYYRIAGAVACVALALNLLMVLGLMVLFEAAFTLPGLAGLVLTVGMSVDANVLIFERIREELDRGAALRMAIRNGFDRATTTIIDANVTTLITGVVLYAIGTDTIKGFAVTLILGILMSMYTAIFCSRLVFDIAERKRLIKSLSFSRMIGKTNIDFLGMRYVASAVSLVLIVIGLIAVYSRGSSLLDIDFAGGSSVTQVLAEGQTMRVAEVRDALEKTELSDKNLTVSELGEGGTRFSITTAEQDVDKVKDILQTTFEDKLLTSKVEIGEVAPFEESGFSGSQVELTLNDGSAYGDEDGFSHDALLDLVDTIVAQKGHQGLQPILTNPNYIEDSNQRFKNWTLRLGLPAADTQEVVEQLQQDLAHEPLFPLANKIGGKVAEGMQTKAIQAILVSLLGIIAYIWFRFQNVAFGLAAVVALVHDVLITLGAVAVSAYLVDLMPPVARGLQLDPFQISLTLIAAFLTIIGYSLNDTIVIFDRVREVRGKNPKLTADMVNTSINQTLSRTLLTSLTTLIVVIILYFFGGPGIHSFAFALVVGVVAGTYSTVFIACPVLLAMVGDKSQPTKQKESPGSADEAA